MLALCGVVSFWLLIVECCWYNVIDCVPFSFSGDRCEQFRRRRRSGIGRGFLFILLGFLFDGFGEVQGQISQPRQAIYWSLIIVSHIVDTLLLFLFLDLWCVILHLCHACLILSMVILLVISYTPLNECCVI
jgi:hypothetical protein